MATNSTKTLHAFQRFDHFRAAFFQIGQAFAVFRNDCFRRIGDELFVREFAGNQLDVLVDTRLFFLKTGNLFAEINQAP